MGFCLELRESEKQKGSSYSWIKVPNLMRAWPRSVLSAVRLALTIPTAALIGLLSTSVFAKLPPPSEETKAKAAEAAIKSAWSDKVGLYKLCLSMDQTAARYRTSSKAAGKPVPAPVPTPPCADPGPYVAQGERRFPSHPRHRSRWRALSAWRRYLTTEYESDCCGNCG